MTLPAALIDRLRGACGAAGETTDYDLNPEVAPAGRSLRPAAVLVPLIWDQDEPRLLLTKRASHLRHHPGQIAFPGGRQDEGDASLEATALREAAEEIGLPPENVSILGALASHETVTSFRMHPFVGVIERSFQPRPEPGEVSEIFTVPLSHVTDPANFSVQHRRWRGQRRNYYTVPYGPYYIWGATARILRGLAGALAP